MAEELADKKHAIFESTLDLIRDHGFHGATMSLVAKNAGVAAGTIYHYFESKDHLICELYQYNRERVVSVIESSLDDRLSYKDNFMRLWTSLFRFYVREPNVLIFFEQFVNSPFNTNKSLNYSRGKLFDFFAAGIRKRVLKPLKAELILLLTMASISSTAKLHVFGKVPVSRTDLARLAEVAWDGIVFQK